MLFSQHMSFTCIRFIYSERGISRNSFIGIIYLVPIWVLMKSHLIAYAFPFFFFFSWAFLWLLAFLVVQCTVHGTYKPLFSTKLLLKMGFTALFTHLKIILLQCFQFSFFSKISRIQTHS